MNKSQLKVKIRNKTGKSYVRKLRKRGGVPAILYGPHLSQSLPLEIEARELRRFLSQRTTEDKIITLKIVDEEVDSQREVMIKSAQRNWIKGGLQHLDFYEITKGEKITTIVPLSFVGKAQGEKKGGIVEHLVRELEIECLPRDIPPAIEVEIESLDIDDSFYVKDLKIPSGIKVITHVEEKVVSVVPPAPKEEEERLEEKREAVAEEVEVVGKEEKKGGASQEKRK